MTKNSDNEPAAGEERPAPPKPRSGSLSGGLALILVLITMVATSYIWFRVLYQEKDLIDGDVMGRLSQIDEQRQEDLKRFDSLKKATDDLKERQDAIIGSLDKINKTLGRDRSDWIIAEAGQLLRIANHRLHLARDIDSAVIALKAADRQLRLLANPRYLPVRKIIAREIASLQSLERADIPGIALRLGNMAENVDRLPIIYKPETEDGTAGNGDGKAPAKEAKDKPSVWQKIWRDLIGLVQIRDSGIPYKILLPPKQQYFLRENVRLMLYSAQQALLQGNTEVYQQNLKAARKWIKLYFDTDSKVARAALDELDNLLGKNIVEKLPNVSGSLSALRKLQRRHRAK
jgi:uroporphyrin-III C-methyltransferase